MAGFIDNGAEVEFNWWISSTPHRNSPLSPNYTQSVVGCVHASNSDSGGYFVVVSARLGSLSAKIASA